MEFNTYIEPSEIITDIVQLVGDEKFSRAEGFYLSFIQKAITELALTDQYQVKVLQDSVPDDLTYDLPKDFSGAREFWLFRGDNCTVENRVNIYRKINYYTRGDGYLANNDWTNSDDPFYSPISLATEDPNLYYWNIQNGVLMFSSNSRSWPRFHLEYNGLGVVFGDKFMVPMFLREAVKDHATYNVLLTKYREDPKLWMPMIQQFKMQMNESWAQAKTRVVMMDQKARQDLYETLSRFGPR